MIRENVRVWLATAPLDMRRGFDRLAEHVRNILAHDPLSGHLFVFANRSKEVSVPPTPPTLAERTPFY